MNDKPTPKANRQKPAEAAPPAKSVANEEADEGLYELADDPDENPAPRPSARAPGSAPAAPAAAKPGAAAGAAMPTGARKAPTGARKPGSAPAAPRRPGRVPSALETGAVLAAARGGPRRSQDADREAAFDVAKKIGLFVGAIVVLIAIVIGVKMLSGGEAPDVGDDAEAKQLITDRNYQEMREWLAAGRQDRTLVGHSPSQTAALVDELYGMGAKTLLAGGTMQSRMMVIELPREDEASRGALIDWSNRWHEKYTMLDRVGQKDEGQRYLVAQMPLNR